MPATQLNSNQLGPKSVNLDDIDTTTTGKALNTKVLAGTNISISSTGVDAGTGVVTVNSTNDTATENANTTPSAPAIGSKLFTRLRAGKAHLGVRLPTGWDELQSHFAYKRIGLLDTLWNATTFSNIGMESPTPLGTNIPATLSDSPNNPLSASKRQTRDTGTTAGTPIGWRSTLATVVRGDVAGMGGFYYSFRFGFVSIASGSIIFVGVRASNAAIGGTVAPSTLVNAFGVCKETADTNFFIMRNDASGTATKVDTGITATAGVVYTLRIFCFPNDTKMYTSIEETSASSLGAGTFYEDTAGYTTKLPGAGNALNWHMHASNNATAASTKMSFAGVYLETPY